MKHACTTCFWVLLFSLSTLVPARAQLATFQRLFYKNGGDLQLFSGEATPDGDGNNDAWKPIIGSDYTVRLVRIYSRWGEEVYASTDTSFVWNGTHNGEDAPSDVYVFYLELNHKDQTVVARKGDITLLR